jgi:hypothetical protein
VPIPTISAIVLILDSSPFILISPELYRIPHPPYKKILNKCINIPCKRFRSPDFIGLKSVPDIVAGFQRW